jgi:hypothetical protein
VTSGTGVIIVSSRAATDQPTVAAIEAIGTSPVPVSARTATAALAGGILIGAGGSVWTGPLGNFWLPDADVIGCARITAYASPMEGAADPTLSQTERWGFWWMTCSVGVPPDACLLILKTAELIQTEVGKRVHNIAINWASLFSYIEILGLAGPKIAFDVAFPAKIRAILMCSSANARAAAKVLTAATGTVAGPVRKTHMHRGCIFGDSAWRQTIHHSADRDRVVH